VFAPPPPPPATRRAMGSVLGRVTEEVPTHELLVKKALYEIRSYPPAVIAATPTQDLVAGDTSFSRLAKYIGGESCRASDGG
jgi:hypothetical protein